MARTWHWACEACGASGSGRTREEARGAPCRCPAAGAGSPAVCSVCGEDWDRDARQDCACTRGRAAADGHPDRRPAHHR